MPCIVVAEDRPDTHRIEPTGRTLVVDGIEYKAYTVEEYKQLAHLITDYHFFWKYSLNLESDIKSYKKEIDLWSLRVAVWEDETKRQERFNDKLSTLFEQENKLRLHLEKSKRAFGWIPWALVIVESVAIGVLGVYSSVNSNIAK